MLGNAMTGDQPVLYLLGTGAQPVLTIATAVEQAQADGWRVCLGLTPTAARWLHPYLPGLEALTGFPVRSHYKLPGQEDVWPTADVVLLAPATFNSVNRWALGLTDSFVIGYAAEALGRGFPTVALPCVNAALAAHPQYARSIETLRLAGARIVLAGDGYRPRPGRHPRFRLAPRPPRGTPRANAQGMKREKPPGNAGRLFVYMGSVEVAGIEPASCGAEPELLRAQSAVLFSAPGVTQTSSRRAQSL
ncbi:hypothetical protein ABH931_004976 [Streptacidiphilus sp. MAP12-33]